ncbi:hypothetical protein [Desulfobaculum sp.]
MKKYDQRIVNNVKTPQHPREAAKNGFVASAGDYCWQLGAAKEKSRGTVSSAADLMREQ